jgi:hypothetical protein
MATCSSGNINPLYNNSFSLSFVGRMTGQFVLLCQRANLPGIKVPDLTQPTSMGTTIPVPSLIAGFEPLAVEFIVDENMDNWISVYRWIKNITNIRDDTHDNQDYEKWHTTATLSIFSSPYSLNGCNEAIKINFENVIPVALGGLNFQSDNTDAVIQKASAQFKYSYYTIVKTNNQI